MDNEAYEYGFDLTDFGDNWQAFTDEALLIHTGTCPDTGAWAWKVFRPSSGWCHMYTANNPVTGEYYSKALARDPEKGYASFIGLTGDKKTVEHIARLIRKHATYIKGNATPGFRAYI